MNFEPTFAADTFIVSKLKAHAPLVAIVSERIYVDEAPQSTKETPLTYPLVIISMQGADDIPAIGNSSILATEPTYQIRAVTRGGRSYAEASNIAKQIHLAIQGKSGQVAVNGDIATVEGIFRVAPFRYSEFTNGISYRHMGGLYRLFVN